MFSSSRYLSPISAIEGLENFVHKQVFEPEVFVACCTDSELDFPFVYFIVCTMKAITCQTSLTNLSLFY